MKKHPAAGILRFSHPASIFCLCSALYCSCYSSSQPMYDGHQENGLGETIDGSSETIDGETREDVEEEIEGEEVQPCLDRDGDGYGEGPGCAGPDCDDDLTTCTTDCFDHDGDGISDCVHFCQDNPHQVGYYEKRGSVAVFVRESHLFLAVGDLGIRVLDIEDPRSPMEIGSIASSGYSIDMDISGDHAFVAAKEGGMRILDISDVTSISEEGYFDTFGSSVSVRGNLAYVAALFGGLLAVDISDVRNPWLVGSFNGAEQTMDVFIKDDLAYVADYPYGGGLRIVDVSDPSSMRQVGFFPIEGFTDDVVVRESYAFVSAGPEGLRILDVGDPENISEIGFYVGSAYYHSVKVFGSYCFIAAEDGLSIIDISDVTRPSLAGFFDTGEGDARDVWYENGHAYLAAIFAGLYVISFECP